MPYCPNCGGEVGKEHHYCGSCGYPLADVNDEDSEIPPSGTAAANRGFLSGRSVEYVHDVTVHEKEIDRESVGYANLSRDVAAGLADFAIVSFNSELNLFQLLHEGTDAGELDRDLDQLNTQQLNQRLAWIGLFQLPALYDQSFKTEWRDQLSERLSEIVELAEEIKEDDSK